MLLKSKGRVAECVVDLEVTGLRRMKRSIQFTSLTAQSHQFSRSIDGGSISEICRTLELIDSQQIQSMLQNLHGDELLQLQRTSSAPVVICTNVSNDARLMDS